MSLKSLVRKTLVTNPLKDDSGVAALVIITIVVVAAGVAISTLSLMNSRRTLEVTQSQRADLDVIRDAILVSALQSADIQLPCPSDPDGTIGTEDRTGTTCNTLRGVVPWQTIGLSPQDVRGGQGLVTYIVDRASTDLCNSTVARAGDIDDLNTAATDNIMFALIEHGRNGLGAVTSSGTFVMAPSSTEELANCAVGSSSDPCGVTNLDEIRTGPASEDAAAFFDDVVLAVDVSTDAFVDANCLELAEEDGDVSDGGSGGEAGQTARGAEFGFGDRQLAQILNRTASDASVEQTLQPTIGDNFTNPDGEIIDGLRFANNGTNDTRSCAWTEIAFPIQSDVTGEDDSHSIRVFLQFGAETDTNNPPRRGDGAVIAVAQTNLDGGGSYELDGTYCGSPGGEYLGFEEEVGGPAITLFPVSPFPRFGIEIDTEDHLNDDDGDGTTNNDNIDNHISIVGMDVDHNGLDIAAQTSTTTVQSAACDGETEGTAGNDGVVRLDPIIAGFIGGALGDPNDTTVTACYTNTDGNDVDPGADLNENTWLEQDDDDDANFHTMRIEIDNRGSASCDAGELLVQYWIWPTDGTFGLNCPYTGLCSDLTDSYAQLQADAAVAQDDLPTGSQCMPWDTTENLVQLALVSGADAGANNTEDQFTVRTFSIASDRDFMAPSEIADQSTGTFEINAPRMVLYLVANNYIDAVTTTTDYTPSGMTLIEQIGSEEAELKSRFGTLHVRFDNTVAGDPEDFTAHEGIGVDGIDNGDGDEEESLGNFYDSGADTEGYLPINLREAIEVRMPNDAYRKAAIGLGTFDLTQNGDPEQAILDFYLEDTLVDRQVVEACDGASGNDAHKVIVVETDAGEHFNKVRITPNPAGSGAAQQDGSGFSVRGVRFCGTDNSCGLMTNNECYEHVNVSNAFPSLGLGVGQTDIYTRTFLQQLAQGQQYVDCNDTSLGVEVKSTANSDPLLGADPGRAAVIDITTGGENYAWLRGNNPDQCNGSGNDPYVDIVSSVDGERVQITVNAGDPDRDGLGYDSAAGGDGALDGGGTDPEETLQLRFPYQWEQIALNLGRFRLNDPERVRVEAYNAGALVDSEVFEACTTGGDATAEVQWTPVGAFDRIDVTAVENGAGGESDFVIRGFRACDAAEAPCTAVDANIYPFSGDDGSDNCLATVAP